MKATIRNTNRNDVNAPLIFDSQTLAARDYWRDKLADITERCVLPNKAQSDAHEPEVSCAQVLNINIPTTLVTAIRELTNNGPFLTYAVFVAGMQTVLYKYTGCPEALVGSPYRVSDDDLVTRKGAVPIHQTVTGEQCFKDLLLGARQSLLDAYKQQAYPLERIESDAPRLNKEIGGLFDVLLSFPSLHAAQTSSKAPLQISLDESSDGSMTAFVRFDPDSLTGQWSERFVGHWLHVLAVGIAEPAQPINQLSLCTQADAEHQQHWNQTEVPGASCTSVHEEMERIADEQAESVALVLRRNEADVQTQTFEELESGANRLAHWLQANEVVRGHRVGLLLSHTLSVPRVVMAILKTGAAYVPLDPSLPAQRIADIVDDADLALIITEDEHITKLEGLSQPLLNLDDAETLQGINAGPVTRVSCSLHDDDLAYILYTSGSTGRPKGCQISHANLRHYACWAADFYVGDNPWGNFALYSSLSFDLTVTSLFLPLITGRTLYVYPNDVHIADVLHDALSPNSPIDALKLTPSHLAMVEQFNFETTNLKVAIVGGEALPTKIAQLLHHLSADVRVFNEYGPTEATVGCAIHEVGRDDKKMLIGRPIDNMRAFVLDPDGQLLPPGVVGRLQVAGKGVSQGYRNLPELNKQSFRAIAHLNEEYVYDTGDLALWSVEGQLVYLGRRDEQVKVLGYRIEMGDIETHLEHLSEVKRAVVCARSVGNAPEPVLVMYVHADHTLNLADVQAHLSDVLPTYMVPQFLVQLDALPLNRNGKVDRNALPDPDISASQKHVPADNLVQAKLVRIWQEVLGISEIGITDNFFDMGGQSLKATQVMSRIHRELAVELNWGTIFSKPTIQELAELIEADSPRPFVAISRTDDAESYPVSHAQHRMWVLHQLTPEYGVYNIADAVRVDGDLNVEQLQHTLNTTIQRHEALRTHFIPVEHGCRQVVLPELSVNLAYQDISNEVSTQAQLDAFIATIAQAPFDLEKGPLLRARLLRLKPQRHVLLLVVHHIICDGWSLDILSRETMMRYSALSRDEVAELPPLPIQYRDFAAWQRQRLDSDAGISDRQFWQDQFASPWNPIELPADRPRPNVQTFAGDHRRYDLDLIALSGLQQLAKEQQASTFMGCLTVVASVLHRYTETSDMIIGTPTAGRHHIDLEDQVGFYVNMLPLRLNVQSDMTFRQLLSLNSEVVQSAQEHQDYPFDRIVDDLQLDRDTSRSPLVDVAVTFNPSGPSAHIPGLSFTPMPIPVNTSKFDLTLTFDQDTDGRWSLGIEYCSDLYNADRIDRMASHIQTLVASAVDNPDLSIVELELLPAAERTRILSEFNPTPSQSSAQCAEQSITTLLSSQVEQTPEAIAIRGVEGDISYRELKHQANGIASQLSSEHGVCVGKTVAVLLKQVELAPAAIIGILQCGAHYLPIDPEAPTQRIAFLMQDAECDTLITDTELSMPSEVTATLMKISASLPQQSNWPAVTVEHSSTAYVAYTSGSTGEPKGAIIKHSSVLQLVSDTNYIDLQPTDRILSTGSLAFDASTFEIWGALLNGASVAFADRDTLLDADCFATRLRDQAITIVFLTTSLFNQLAERDAEMFSGLRVLLSGGERVSPRHVNAVRKACPKLQLIHVYGPTENTTFSTYYPVTQDYVDNIPIGRPISNSSAYIVDSGGRLAPIGVPGELWTGGGGVAQGYLNRPELTSQRFQPNPFGDDIIYRTGDRAVWDVEGNITFVGRIDGQVKVRGFRVELGEIEHRLRTHTAIRDAAVIARRNAVNTTELIAYYLCRSDVNVSDLRNHLALTLPAFMIPAFMVEVDDLVLNSSGKIDRGQLLNRPVTSPVTENIGETSEPLSKETEQNEAVQGERERAVLDAFSAVLGVNHVPRDVNLFEHGNDSIKSIQAVGRLTEAGWKVSVKQIFQFPTIARLAAQLTPIDTSAIGHSELMPTLGKRGPITPLQRWFLNNHNGPLDHFNQDVLLRAQSTINVDALEKSIAGIVAQHTALRMTFVQDGELEYQYEIGAPQEINVDLVDLRTSDDSAKRLEEHAQTVQSSLCLDGPLLAAVVYRLADGDRLLLVVHHMLIDGVSWRILLEDLEQAYAQASNGDEILLSYIPKGFDQWANTCVARTDEPELNAQLDYWLAQWRDVTNPLPIDQQLVNTYGTSKVAHARVSDETSKRITRLGVSAQVLLLAAFGRSMASLGLGNRVSVTLEGHGRPEDDASLARTIGWFTSLYPFTVDGSDLDVDTQLRQIRSALDAVPNGGRDCLSLFEQARQEGSISGTEKPGISFNYLGEMAQEASSTFFTPADEDSGDTLGPDLTRAHELEVVCVIIQGRLTVSLRYVPGRINPDLVDRLLAAMLESITELTELAASKRWVYQCEPSEVASISAETQLPVEQIDNVYPVTPLQQGLLFEAELSPDSRAYVLQADYRISGVFDSEKFRASWDLLCRRHAALRTAFVCDGVDAPLQVVVAHRDVEFVDYDLCDLRLEDSEDYVANYRRTDLARSFSLARDPLMRFALFRLSDSEIRLIWTYHHLVVDGWSLGVLLDELGVTYQALTDSQASNLPLAPSYHDYIEWLGQVDSTASLAFWSDYLSGYDTLATLRPVWHRSSPEKNENNEEVNVIQEDVFYFDATTSQGLVGCASNAAVTLATVFQALWGLLLCGSNCRDDAVFGTIVSGRPAELPRADGMVGLVINAIPVRVDPEGDESLETLLQRLQGNSLDCQSHSYLPLADIQAQTSVGRELFDHLLVFENYPRRWGGDDAERDFTIEELSHRDHTHYKLCVVINPGERISVRFAYNEPDYPADSINRIWQQLHSLAEIAVNQTELNSVDIHTLSATAQVKLLAEFSHAAPRTTLPSTTLDRIAQQVQQNPTAIAIQTERDLITYAELWQQVGAVSETLCSRGVQPGDYVVLLADRSALMIVGMLACWLTEAAYVPLEIDDSSERQQSIVRSHDTSLFLVDKKGKELLPESCRTRAVELQAAAEKTVTPTMTAKLTANAPAYLIYTSGSTGQPKGCIVGHDNLSNYLSWADKYYFGNGPGGNLPLFTSVSFDMSVTSLFLPLMRGQTVHVYSSEQNIEELLIALIRDNPGIDTIKLTPSHIAIIESLALKGTAIKRAIVGGEALLPHHINTLRRLNPAIRIFNEYGPTEATVGCIVKEVTTPTQTISIGTAIDNTDVYLLDHHLRPVSVGNRGELYIGGAGITLGYLNDADKTASKFLDDPFVEGGRIYATGDLGCWLDNGEIQLLGRADQQIKIRGYRVELGEIESSIAALSDVDSAAVCTYNLDTETRLVAYVAGKGLQQSDVDRLKQQLGKELPEYLIPEQIVVLNSLPTTTNGKLDQSRLPNPATVNSIESSIDITDPVEARLMHLWQQTLGHCSMTTSTNFFQLGGHSLKAMQILAAVHRDFSVRVSLRQFFAEPSIEGLAKAIRQGQHSEYEDIQPATPQADYALAHAQKRLWLMQQLQGERAYNMPDAIILHGEIDVEALEHAFATLIARHEILRTAFVERDGEPRQVILADIEFKIRVRDLSNESDPESAARKLAEDDAVTPFDLSAPPLFRVWLFTVAKDTVAKGRHLFLFDMHHIIGDGWSNAVLSAEVQHLYEAYKHQRPHKLPAIRIQYKDFTEWQQNIGFEESQRYWLKRLGNADGILPLPYDYPRTEQRDFSGANVTTTIDESIVLSLQAYARDNQTTLSNVVLTLFKLFLHKLTGQRDIWVGLATANRSHPDLEDMIGFFVNLLPIRTDLDPDMEFDDLLKQVVNNTYDALSHEHYPFDLLVQTLRPERHGNWQPLLNIVYGFQNYKGVRTATTGNIELGESDLDTDEVFPLAFKTSKFDLVLFVMERNQSLTLTLEYDNGLFSESTVVQYLESIHQFATAIAASTSQQKPDQHLTNNTGLSEEKHENF
ncbi:MAG: amino acid adenylation domain-containing protein [Arenicella sp.]